MTGYGVKVYPKEGCFLDWEIEPEVYQRSEAFPQLKGLGFESLGTAEGLCQSPTGEPW